MHETTYIKDPDTFRQKEDGLQHSEVNEKTINHKTGIHCPQKSNSYECEICSRLRQTCPFGTKSIKNTHLHQNTIKTNVASKPVHKPANEVRHFATPPRRVRVIEEVVYYPEIHNVIVQHNPELSVAETSLNTTSPNYKYRHRSTTIGNDKFSSPIRVGEYEEEILTPQQLKNLTESMIN